MKKFYHGTWELTLIFLTFLFVTSRLSALDIQDYVDDIPGIGLVADEINFDGITLKNLSFVDSKAPDDTPLKFGAKYVITKPLASHTVVVEYEIDASVLTNFDLHHFIYGLYPDGPQGCFLHSTGIKNSSGRACFNLKAPEKPGVYQLRFCHATGYGTYESVKNGWWEDGSATSKTIMGVVVVSNE